MTEAETSTNQASETDKPDLTCTAIAVITERLKGSMIAPLTDDQKRTVTSEALLMVICVLASLDQIGDDCSEGSHLTEQSRTNLIRGITDLIKNVRFRT